VGLPLFSLEVFLFDPIAFWDYLFFHQRSFILSPLCFGVASFSLKAFLFEPTSEGCENAHLVMALA
jgi:hypothetical protein